MAHFARALSIALIGAAGLAMAAPAAAELTLIGGPAAFGSAAGSVGGTNGLAFGGGSIRANRYSADAGAPVTFSGIASTLELGSAGPFGTGVALGAPISDVNAAAGAAPPTEATLLRNRVSDDGDAGHLPEPATWVLMLFGFGSMGFIMRRPAGRSRSPRIRFS